MIAKPVEWVLVVYYGPEAHRATYGRQVKSTRYTKDYIQLSRKKAFLEAVMTLFSIKEGASGSVPLTYHWPAGTTSGAFVFNSSDRPHLKWETRVGAPQVWKMTLDPSDVTPETIPGDPTFLDFSAAENEFQQLAKRGAGQPYLMVIKLQDEPGVLHLRAYLKDPSQAFSWADLKLAPIEVQALAQKTSQNSALAWSYFQSGGAIPSWEVSVALSKFDGSADPVILTDQFDVHGVRTFINYLKHPGYGLFFDPGRNHDAWIEPARFSTQVTSSVADLLLRLEERFPEITRGDAVAEALEVDPVEVEAFLNKIEQKSYEVADSTATVKTRGSAQRAFAKAVKSNYENQCAITGVVTRHFLVASHIVPWSQDQTIRLDPSNGICLSLLVDRAFEQGLLLIEDDLTIRVDLARLGSDHALRELLEPYNGKKLFVPKNEAPQLAYLQRRRALIAATD